MLHIKTMQAFQHLFDVPLVSVEFQEYTLLVYAIPADFFFSCEQKNRSQLSKKNYRTRKKYIQHNTHVTHRGDNIILEFSKR